MHLLLGLKYAKNYLSVEVVCGSLHELYQEYVNSDLSSVSVANFLKYTSTKVDNSHFILDEMSSKWLKRDSAQVISNLFENELKNSHVIFCQQSIHKDCAATFKESSRKVEIESGNYKK